MNSEEMQLCQFGGDGLPEIGALAPDKTVKIRPLVQEPDLQIKVDRLENGARLAAKTRSAIAKVPNGQPPTFGNAAAS